MGLFDDLKRKEDAGTLSPKEKLQLAELGATGKAIPEGPKGPLQHINAGEDFRERFGEIMKKNQGVRSDYNGLADLQRKIQAQKEQDVSENAMIDELMEPDMKQMPKLRELIKRGK